MKNEKYASLAVLGVVVIVALVGVVLLIIDDGINAEVVNPNVWGRGGQYEEDAAEWDWQPGVGGRGRRYRSDAG